MKKLIALLLALSIPTFAFASTDCAERAAYGREIVQGLFDGVDTKWAESDAEYNKWASQPFHWKSITWSRVIIRMNAESAELGPMIRLPDVQRRIVASIGHSTYLACKVGV